MYHPLITLISEASASHLLLGDPSRIERFIPETAAFICCMLASPEAYDRIISKMQPVAESFYEYPVFYRKRWFFELLSGVFIGGLSEIFRSVSAKKRIYLHLLKFIVIIVSENRNDSFVLLVDA